MTFLALTTSPIALAQDTQAAEPAPVLTAEPPPEAPAIEPAPPPPPAAPPEPPAAPTPVVVPDQEARAMEPPPTPAEDTFKPKLTIGAGLRTGLSLSFNPGDTQLNLSDSLDQLMFRPFFAGQLTKKIGMFVQLEATSGGVSIIDGYLDLKLFDEFQVLIGQHIPANDRNNFSGPFFNNSWNFAAVHSYPFDAAARDRGFTFWGLFAKGIIKYHLSMVDLQAGRDIGEARFAGRLTFNFLDPETSYYASETYFGKSDTLAIGVVGSYQKGPEGADGSDADMLVDGDKNGDGELDNDFGALSADLLFEKNISGAGTFGISAAYWNFSGVGDEYIVNQGSRNSGRGFVGALAGNVSGQSFQVNVSWLSPAKLGPGQLQPNFRVQGFDEDAGDAMIYDVGLGYIVDGFNHLWRLNYRHANNPGDGTDEDSIQLGAQLQI